MTTWKLHPTTGAFYKARPKKKKDPNSYPSRDPGYRKEAESYRYQTDDEYRQRVQERERRRRWATWVPEVPPMGDSCEICGSPDGGVTTKRGTRRVLHMDHDHATKTFRGWLCHHCNAGIGMFGDDPDRMEAALRYLRRFREGAK